MIQHPSEPYRIQRNEVAVRISFFCQISNCGAELHGFNIEFHYSECPECGMQQQGIWISTTGAFAFGALVGLGIGALLTYILSKRKKKGS